MNSNITIGLSTDKGNFKNQNEDNFIVDGKYLNSDTDNLSFKSRCKSPMMFAVCDGIGGSFFGKEAAFIAVKSLDQNYKELNLTVDDQLLIKLNGIIKAMNSEVYSLVLQGKKTGCTLASAYVHTDSVYISNVGDSKVYRITDTALEKLSVDHTMSGRLIQYIGMPPQEIAIDPHYQVLPLEDMYLLISSDGLSEALSESDIFNFIHKKLRRNPKKIADTLIMEARKQGARDNITVMLIKIKTNKRGVKHV